MEADPISRRNFLTNLSATGAILSLSDNPFAGAESKYPFSHPAYQREDGPVKILCIQKLSDPEIQQITSAGKDIKLHMVKEPKELKAHVADAEVIFGSVDASVLAEA